LNPSSYEPESNLLFRNDGDGTFTEIATELGVHNPEGRSFTGLWHDFDGDGWTDLYVANDISDNTFYLNRSGRFTEISHPAMVADYRGAMGLALGDWNADGDDDLFITHWIAQENALYDSLLANLREPPAGTPIRFIDIADRVGLGQVALQSIGWGTEFADLDGDGWLDLVVANGSTFETESSPPGLRPQAPFLFWNDRGQSFHDLAPMDQNLAIPHVGRGLALSDWDDDGDLDLLIMNHGEGAQLLRNDMTTGGWVKIRLRSRLTPQGPAVGSGEGAVLMAEVDGRTLRRTVTGTSYLSQSSRTVHFGLGEAQAITSLEVLWPGGGKENYGGLPAGTRWEIVEGDPTAHPVAPRGDIHQQTRSFWESQRAAVRALKVDGDRPQAIRLFRAALSLRPDHEDSLYYLGQCLAETGDIQGALEQFAKMSRVDPASHRARSQWGLLRAASATSMADLDAAAGALERAVQINPEETGALLGLAEINLVRGEQEQAEQRLEWVCRTNQRAVAGFFLRGFLAWKKGDRDGARKILSEALTARGPDWKPAGGTAEGDLKTAVETAQTLLSPYEQNWSGSLDDLDQVFKDLATFVETFKQMK
jgi:Tfp pilus assembly protein PilF